MYAQPRPLTSSLPASGGEPEVVVEPLQVGEINAPASFIAGTSGRISTRLRFGRGPRLRMPVGVCLIHHPAIGPILVDTGLHGSVATDPAANLGKRLTTLMEPSLPPGHMLSAQLRARGLEAGDIKIVILTHLHAENASGIAGFSDAQFVVSLAEWRAASGESGAMPVSYYRPHYDYAFDFRTVDFDSAAIGSYGSFSRTFDLFGDGSIRLAFTPGHSGGHISVICRLQYRDLIIAGDALMSLDELEGGKPIAVPQDAHLFSRSLSELRRFHQQFPDTEFIPGHDPEFTTRLPERFA